MARSFDVYRHIDGKRRRISADAQIRALAERQHGVVTRAQLMALGIGPDLIDHRLATRRIETVHRGVFALSRELLSREGLWLASVMAIGEGAALSHSSAAAHWRIRPYSSGVPHVTTSRRVRRQEGIRLHYLPLADDEVTLHDGIPVTTPARTVLDLAASLNLHALRRTMREADFLRLAAGPSLPELVTRYPGRTGIANARALLADGWSALRTRNDFEDAFLALVEQAELPRPEVNALVEAAGERFEVDFLWRQARLIVELDGFQSHGTRSGFEADRRRDRILQLAGFDVFRVTYRALTQDQALLRDLRRRLHGGA